MPTLTYQFGGEPIYISPDDFDGYDSEYYEYNVDIDEWFDFLSQMFADEYHIDNKTAYNILSDCDLWDIYEERYETDAEDYFYDKAYEEWSNNGE